jgi:hypothetical protein
MARRRKERNADDIKLKQPDRSAPTEETLLQFAQDLDLFGQAERDPRNKSRKNRAAARPNGSSEDKVDGEARLSPAVDRVMEALLWTVSLAMLHLTLDVLVQHQYAVTIKWLDVVARTVQAFLGA